MKLLAVASVLCSMGLMIPGVLAAGQDGPCNGITVIIKLIYNQPTTDLIFE